MGAMLAISAMLRYTGMKPRKLQIRLHITAGRPPPMRPCVKTKILVSRADDDRVTKEIMENVRKWRTSSCVRPMRCMAATSACVDLCIGSLPLSSMKSRRRPSAPPPGMGGRSNLQTVLFETSLIKSSDGSMVEKQQKRDKRRASGLQCRNWVNKHKQDKTRENPRQETVSSVTVNEEIWYGLQDALHILGCKWCEPAQNDSTVIKGGASSFHHSRSIYPDTMWT